MNELSFNHESSSSRARCFNCAHSHDVVCTICHQCGCRLYARKGKTWINYKSLQPEREQSVIEQQHPDSIQIGEKYFIRCAVCKEQTRPTTVGSAHFKIPRLWALRHFHEKILNMLVCPAEE